VRLSSPRWKVNAFFAAFALSVMPGGPAWATIDAQLETFLTM